MNTRSKAFAAVLSVILPGAGHLYLGLSKTGLLFMGAFFGCITLITWSLLPLIFSFGLVVIWFYGLFDALQKTELLNAEIAARQAEQADQVTTSPTPSLLDEQNTGQSALWLGGALIVLGLVLLVRIALPQLWVLLNQTQWVGVVAALFFIGFGIRLIGKQFGWFQTESKGSDR